MDFERARDTMVNSQIRTIDVTDQAVLAAFLGVRREAYVPAGQRHIAYCDGDIPLAGASKGRALPSAGAWAKLVQLLAPSPADTVLMIGSAGGYAAAILARLVAHVVVIEADPLLAQDSREAWKSEGASNIELRDGDIARALKGQEKFDRIIIEGAVEILPAGLAGHLAANGRLVAVIGAGRSAKAHLFAAQSGGTSGQPMFDLVLPGLPGFGKKEAFEFTL